MYEIWHDCVKPTTTKLIMETIIVLHGYRQLYGLHENGRY